MIKKLFSSFSSQRELDKREELRRNFKRHEAQIGGKLFGPVKPGGRREFFCLDQHTWIWYEEWLDDRGKRQAVTTRYEIRPSGILKSQNGHPFQNVSLIEARSLREASKLYLQGIKDEIYSPIGIH